MQIYTTHSTAFYTDTYLYISFYHHFGLLQNRFIQGIMPLHWQKQANINEITKKKKNNIIDVIKWQDRCGWETYKKG